MNDRVRRCRRGPVVMAVLLGAAASAGPTSGQEPLSWGEMQAALADRSAPAPAARVAYREGPHTFGELRLPPGPGPHPVVVVVHGGCWQSMAGLDYMDPFALALNEMGWATWSLEFRRIDQPGGAWPGILEDVAAGADFLRELARDYPLRLDRVVTAGHSSGGHLALWLAARHRLPADGAGGPRLRGDDPLAVAGVVGLAPIADLRDYTRYTRCGPTIVADFLGGVMDEDRLRLSDPASLAPTGVPQLLVLGALDPIVPPTHGAVFAAGSREAGDAVEVAVVEDGGHFELVSPWTAPWRTVADLLAGFLARVPGTGP
ncbi:MAG TPA: alpha/beta hydrolase [Longimicrobiales bacterium]|nr:alpha/beta hydrolase [Longimicrobiales bacterium]